MEIKKRTQDLEEVFNQRWKANNFHQNGVKQNIEKNKEFFNKMYNIKSKEDKKKEMLEANSVNGRVARLEEKMKAASAGFNKKNNFR